MIRLATIRYLLSALAVLGLIFAPVVQPAMGAISNPSMSVSSMEDMAHSNQSTVDAAMPDGMPCCPDQTPDCSKNCPLMALCMAQLIQDAPAWTGLLAPLSPGSVVASGNDRALTGQSHGPPPRPPKTSI